MENDALIRRNLVGGLAALGALALATRAQGLEAAQSVPKPARWNQAWPNCALTTHEGRQVKFYDDLIRGKLVVINMMFARCFGICPLMTRNLLNVQSLLGNRVGKEVFMYSVTLRPEEDTPEVLREYAEMHEVKPGWQFLTGAPADIDLVRNKLGFYDPDPAVDRVADTHTGALRIGNDAYKRWAMAPSLAEPRQIVTSILHLDRTPSAQALSQALNQA
jgi:protein SCO1